MARVILSKSHEYADDDPGLSLDYFCRDLELYSSRGKHKLVQVDHYKEKSRYDHEFLVFEITHGNYKSGSGKDNIYLRMERRPSGQTPLHTAGSFQRVTNDTIKRVRPDFDWSPYYHLFTVSRHPEKELSLSDICKMYQPIRIISPTYDPVSHNCYWFCNKFLQNLAEELQVSGCPGKDYRLRSTFAVGFTRVYPNRLARSALFSFGPAEDAGETSGECWCLPVMIPWRASKAVKRKASEGGSAAQVVEKPSDGLISKLPAQSLPRIVAGPSQEKYPINYDSAPDITAERENVTPNQRTVWELDETRLMTLEDVLQQKISWQPEAVEAVAHAITVSTAKKKTNRPIASLIFAGPAGRQQRDVAEALAQELFGNCSLIIEILKIKSSYFGDEVWFSTGCYPRRESHFHYDSFGGEQLLQFVNQNPRCCILVTERIENIPPKILEVFLRILDQSQIHDQDRVVDFRETVLILSTGVADRFLESQVGEIPEEKRRKIDETIRCELEKIIQAKLDGSSPSFLDWFSRFTIAPFRALWDPEAKKEIIQKEVQDLQLCTDVSIHVNVKAEKWLMKRGVDFEHGANLASELMSQRLLHRINEGDVRRGDRVEFRMNARSNALRCVVPTDDFWSRFLPTLSPTDDAREFNFTSTAGPVFPTEEYMTEMVSA